MYVIHEGHQKCHMHLDTAVCKLNWFQRFNEVPINLKHVCTQLTLLQLVDSQGTQDGNFHVLHVVTCMQPHAEFLHLYKVSNQSAGSYGFSHETIKGGPRT